MTKYLRSNAVAFLALFVALGGSSYAAFALPAGSVGTKQLRAGAVTAAKVRKGSLLAGDFKHGQLPRGPLGATGPQGIQGIQGIQGFQGLPGSARAYADVQPGGQFQTGYMHPGFTSVAATATGTYCITPAAGVDPSQDPPVVSPDYHTSPDLFPSAMFDAASPSCSHGYEVVTFRSAAAGPAFANEGFSIIVP